MSKSFNKNMAFPKYYEQESYEFPDPPTDGEDNAYYDNDEHQERTDLLLQRVFVVERGAEYETKSKDRLTVKFMPDESKEHFSLSWAKVAAVYTVGNLTKIEKGQVSVYTVSFYRAKSGAVLLAHCDCPARVLCKHIGAAWKTQVDAEYTGFVPQI